MLRTESDDGRDPQLHAREDGRMPSNPTPVTSTPLEKEFSELRNVAPAIPQGTVIDVGAKVPAADPNSILSDAQELLQANSWPDLVRYYSNRGKEFSSDQELLDQIKVDWKTARVALIQEALAQESIGAPLLRKITTDGGTCCLMGVVHDRRLLDRDPHNGLTGSNYLDKIFKACEATKFWATEQNLTNTFLPIPVPEIGDHLADGQWIRLVESWDRMYLAPIRKAWSKLQLHAAQLSHPEYRRPSDDDLVRSMTHLPPDAVSEVPPKVDLMWRDRNNLPLTRSQRRSMFLAALVQDWDPAAMVKSMDLPADHQPQPTPTDLRTKGIIMGAAHVPEAEYFLINGLREDRVTERGRFAASKLNEGPRAYQNWFTQQELIHTALSYTSAIGIGCGAAYALSCLTSMIFR